MEELELEVERGPARGQRLSLRGDWTIGSAESGPGTLWGDRWLSPQQAQIRMTPEGWVIEDLRSAEGTRVNGEPVREPRLLHPRDTIELGSTRLMVLPPEVESISELPEVRAERAADDLRSESRRHLDSRRLGAFVTDSLLMLPVYLALRQNGTIVAALASVAVGLTYFFVLESLTGQTLGKALFGLRVVSADGRPLRAHAVSARTVLRLLDEIGAGLVGMLTMIITGGRRQRLGDLAARTVVARASTPFRRAPLEGRNLLALLAYPAVWIAPAILLYAVVPEARLKDCGKAQIDAGVGREGSCIRADGRVLTIVNAGHTLHMKGFDVRAAGAKVEHVRIPRLAGRPGFEDGSAAVVEIKVAVTNRGSRPLPFDRGARDVRLLVSVNDYKVPVSEIPPRLHIGSRRPLSAAQPRISPGKTVTGWTRFALPTDAVPNVTEDGSDLEVLLPSHEDGDRHVGHIRLWRASTVQGGTVLAHLRE